MLFVDTRRLSVRVSAVVIRVEHLHFVKLLQEYAAVPTVLAVSGCVGRRAPLDVQLNVAESADGFDTPRTGNDRHYAVFDLPLEIAAVSVLPAIGAGASQQNDRVGRRHAALTGLNGNRLRIPYLGIFGLGSKRRVKGKVQDNR